MAKQLSLVSNATVNGIQMSDIKSPPVDIQLDKMTLDLLWNNCPRVDPAWYQIWDYPGGHYSISEVFSLLWRDPSDRYQHKGNVARTVDLLKYKTDTLAIFPFSYIIWQKPSTTLYTQDETVTLILTIYDEPHHGTESVFIYIDGVLIPNTSFKGTPKRGHHVTPYRLDVHFTKGIHTFMARRNARHAPISPAMFSLNIKFPRVIQPFNYLTPLYIRYYAYPNLYSHALLHQPATSMLTYIVYCSTLDLEASQLIADKKGFPLLPTEYSADPTVYNASRDDNNIVCIGGHFANPYSKYYFPNLAVDANGRLVGESGISVDGRYIVSTKTRSNGTTVTIIAGLDASDTLAAAFAYCGQSSNKWL